jgi:hypothetical protein
VGETIAFIAERRKCARLVVASADASAAERRSPVRAAGTPDTSLRATPVARRVAKELAVELRLVQVPDVMVVFERKMSCICRLQDGASGSPQGRLN